MARVKLEGAGFAVIATVVRRYSELCVIRAERAGEKVGYGTFRKRSGARRKIASLRRILKAAGYEICPDGKTLVRRSADPPDCGPGDEFERRISFELVHIDTVERIAAAQSP